MFAHLTNLLIMSPIPTRELSDMHLKAVSEILTLRKEIGDKTLSHEEFDAYEQKRVYARDLHHALNQRLERVGMVTTSFDRFLRDIERM